MMKGIITASAPGSLMLLGEHAVLHGARALVAAANRRIRVTLSPWPDRRIRIVSPLGRADLDPGRIDVPPSLRFVAAALAQHRRGLQHGMELRIRSNVSHQVGLGSSAAVTVATLAVLRAHLGLGRSRLDLLREARTVIRRVQGAGSGADAAASVYGGVVLYRAEPLSARRVAASLPITVVFSGSKRPTAEVIDLVAARRRRNRERFDDLFAKIDDCARRGASAAARGDDRALGELFDAHQDCMAAIGVSNAHLEAIVQALRNSPDIRGAKISGSGLGDCIIGLGRARRYNGPGRRLPVTVSSYGVQIERKGRAL